MAVNMHSDAANPSIHFGKQVRKARREHGWTLRDLGERTKLAVGYLSNIENGKRRPTVGIALRMDDVFPEKRGWFTEFHHDSQEWAPPGYRNWGEYENVATHLRVWCPSVVHGLVQTEAYARVHLEVVTDVPAEVIDARVRARMERQKRILHRENPPSVWILVDEAALFRLEGTPEIMAAQMDHLISVASMPNVVLQVMPAITHPVNASELIVTDNAAYCEHVAGGYTFTDGETLSSLDRLITTLQAESYRASESVRLIERVRDVWASAAPGESLLTALLRADRASK